MEHFHSIGLILLWRMSFVSSAMKMFAKATAILVPMAVPRAFADRFQAFSAIELE